MSLQDTVLMQLRDLILSGQFEPGHRLAEQQLADWQRVFGDGLHLELTRTGRDGEESFNQFALMAAGQRGLPVIASNDVRFLSPDDFDAHEARVCIASGRVLDDPKRPKEYSAEQYMKSAEQMAELASAKGIMFHTDAVQAVGKIPIDLKNTKIICRSGDPTDLFDLSIVNPHTSRSIIVLSCSVSSPDRVSWTSFNFRVLMFLISRIVSPAHSGRGGRSPLRPRPGSSMRPSMPT